MALSWIIDLILVAVLLISYLRGRKKGLILVLCGIAAIFVALFGARFISQQLSPMVAEAMTPHFTTLVEEEMKSAPTDTPDQFLTEEDEEHSPLTDILEQLGLNGPLAAPVRDSFGQQITQAATDTATALARAIAETVASVVVFVLAFILLLILWFFLSRLLNLAAHLPIIKGLNRLFGGLVGLIQGALVLFFVVWILRICGAIPTDFVESTTVLKFFATTSPISILAGI